MLPKTWGPELRQYRKELDGWALDVHEIRRELRIQLEVHTEICRAVGGHTREEIEDAVSNNEIARDLLGVLAHSECIVTLCELCDILSHVRQSSDADMPNDAKNAGPANEMQGVARGMINEIIADVKTAMSSEAGAAFLASLHEHDPLAVDYLEAEAKRLGYPHVDEYVAVSLYDFDGEHAESPPSAIPWRKWLRSVVQVIKQWGKRFLEGLQR